MGAGWAGYFWTRKGEDAVDYFDEILASESLVPKQDRLFYRHRQITLEEWPIMADNLPQCWDLCFNDKVRLWGVCLAMAADAVGAYELTTENMLHVAARVDFLKGLRPHRQEVLEWRLNDVFKAWRVPLQACLWDLPVRQRSPLAAVRYLVRREQAVIAFIRRAQKTDPIFLSGADEPYIIVSDPLDCRPYRLSADEFWRLMLDVPLRTGRYVGQILFNPRRLLTISRYPP